MKASTAMDTKYSFVWSIVPARTEHMAMAEHGRPVTAVIVVGNFVEPEALGALLMTPVRGMGERATNSCESTL